MHTLLIIGDLLLLGICAILFIAFVQTRRSARDIAAQLTEAREQQHQYNLQLTQRSQLDTLKDEFIATVSHELRTPLTSIRGSLGLLSSGVMGDVDAKALNLLRIAVSNTDRLIRLINDILDIERMESGRAPLQIRRCSLRELCQQAIETMTPMADANTVHLELISTTDATGTRAVSPHALFFDGDSDRILQVLTNLLSNAIKFSPAASTVRIHTEATADSILLKIADEGRGIPGDKLDSIFDRFQQVEPSDARQKGGTGLGLSICRSIVQQHSGSIWAQRNLGPGTTFYVLLPRVARASDIAHRPAPLPSPDNASILVCDDDPGIRTVVSEHLQRQGYTVVEATSGEQALLLAAEHQVQAILLDLYMPGLSGWETLQHLRNNPRTAQIPVVVLSVLSSTLRPQFTGDAQGWVQKPFNEKLLFAELSRILHRGDGPANVLLVEDDIDLASVVLASFQSAAVRIDHAATRRQAIRQCMESPPDLLILDLTLPDGDGFSLVEWLRQQPTLRTLPLIVYSGREISDSEMAQLRLGPTQFLTKARVQPKEVEELVLSMVQSLRTQLPALAASSRQG